MQFYAIYLLEPLSFACWTFFLNFHEHRGTKKGFSINFFEKLNPNSDIPKDVFQKEKEGYIDASAKGRGYLESDESEWFTHPDLEKLYNTIDRQSIPAAYDASSQGNRNKILLK